MKQIVLALALIAVFAEPLYAQRNADVLRGLPGYIEHPISLDSKLASDLGVQGRRVRHGGGGEAGEA